MLLAAARSKVFDRTTFAVAAVLLVATALRVWALELTPLNLNHDEAEFWAWSQAPAWGYLSAQPMVAWAISATTHFFGDTEWAVRLAGPIAQACSALGLYALGRSVYGAWAGFWVALAWLLTPGVWYASNIITNDALLLPFWTLGLVAMWRMVQTRAWAWAATLGIAIGCGFYAAYAMLYFPLCLALAARWSQPVREALKGGRGVLAALLTLLIITPNLVWNAQHGFESAQQAAANLNINAANLFNSSKIAEFLTGQALLIGPLVFFILIGLMMRAAGRAAGLWDEDRFLLAFTLPPLVLVTAFAVIAHADANWAVTAYPAALTWIVGSLIGNVNGRRAFAAAMFLNVVIGGVIALGFFHPNTAGAIRGVRESAGWSGAARAIALRAVPLRGERPFSAVLVDDQAAYYELNYYWTRRTTVMPDMPPLRFWQMLGPGPTLLDANQPMRAQDGARVLVVHASPTTIPLVAGDFTTFRTVEHLTVSLGGGLMRALDLSIGEGFAPARRDAAFMNRMSGLRAVGS